MKTIKMEKFFLLLAVVAFAAAAQGNGYGKKYQESGALTPNKDDVLYEVGEVDGISYAVSPDRKGVFFDNAEYNDESSPGLVWFVRCMMDEITDVKRCYVDGGPIRVMLMEENLFVSLVPDDLDEDGATFIRIDKYKAHSTKKKGIFYPDDNRKMLEQMMAGNEIKTRHTSSQTGLWIDSTYSLRGFKQALGYIKWAYDNYPSDAQK